MLTPKPYLSWTQLNTFETSPEAYKRLYIDGQKLPINRGMAFGKQVATMLETGEKTDDLFNDFVVEQLPSLGNHEYKLCCEVEVDKIKIPLLCYLDSVADDLSTFIEYKTGKIAWDQKKVDKHGQITFYSLAIKCLTGKIPNSCLIWAPTTETSDNKIMLTGEIKRFNTKRTELDILKMKIRIKKAWLGINALMEGEIL